MEKIYAINSDMLKWARESAGIISSKEYDSWYEKILKWERGEDYPTYAQLESLSKMYNKPMALFFFPYPPKTDEINTSFRTLENDEFKLLPSKIIKLINEAKVMQLNLSELYGDIPSEAITFFGELKNCTYEEKLKKVRKLLKIDILTQFNISRDTEMFEIWRNAFADNGIYIFKEVFKDQTVSGFCLHDNNFPVIYINNKMSLTRQIFTLFHELYHLFFGTSGIDKVEEDYNNIKETRAKEIEISCNKFAADFLIPDEEICKDIDGIEIRMKEVEKLSKKYLVSKECMILKLIQLGKIEWGFYYQYKNEHPNAEIRAKTTKENGGSYYNNIVNYLGKRYLNLAFTGYNLNKFDSFQMASYVKTKVGNISSLEQAWGWK